MIVRKKFYSDLFSELPRSLQTLPPFLIGVNVRIKKIAEHFANVFGVKFFYEDFRAGWQEGIDLSLELGLYRQNYCGCIFSEEERFSNDLRKARKKFFRNGR